MARSLAGAKRVIQNRVTEEFYLGQGQWTRDLGAAKEFTDIVAALNETVDFGFGKGCDLLLIFTDRRHGDVRLPLSGPVP